MTGFAEASSGKTEADAARTQHADETIMLYEAEEMRTAFQDAAPWWIYTAASSEP